MPSQLRCCVICTHFIDQFVRILMKAKQIFIESESWKKIIMERDLWPTFILTSHVYEKSKKCNSFRRNTPPLLLSLCHTQHTLLYHGAMYSIFQYMEVLPLMIIFGWLVMEAFYRWLVSAYLSRLPATPWTITQRFQWFYHTSNKLTTFIQ